jgi:hypothetical protein
VIEELKNRRRTRVMLENAWLISQSLFQITRTRRVPRPPMIGGLPVDEFLARNADPIWLPCRHGKLKNPYGVGQGCHGLGVFDMAVRAS